MTRLVPAAVLALGMVAAGRCQAQHAVFAPASYADAVATIGELAKQTSEITNTLQTVRNVLNVQGLISQVMGNAGSLVPNIGNLAGTGDNQTIGQVMALATTGMTAYTDGKNAYEQIMADITAVENLSLNMQTGFSIPDIVGHQFGSLQTMANPNATGMIGEMQVINAVTSGTETPTQGQYDLSNTFYTQTTTPSDGQINRVGLMRRSNTENAALGGMMMATTTESSLDNLASNTLGSLSTSIGSAKTLRADIQVNSAIEMKMLEQVTAQTAVLAWLVRVRSATMINRQNTTGATTNWTNYTTGQ